MKHAGALIVSASLIFPAFANDKEWFDQARIALDRHNDCKTALELLSRMDKASQAVPEWILYAAKANQCAGKESDALTLFERFNRLAPGEPFVSQSISELRYKGKFAWRKTFCLEAQKVAAAWPDDFKTIRTRKTGTTTSIFRGELWEHTADFQRPWYRNVLRDDVAEIWVDSARPRTAFAVVRLLRTPAGRPRGRNAGCRHVGTHELLRKGL